MVKRNEMTLPEDAEIELRVIVSTPKFLQIEILADSEPYASGTIPVGATGTFSLGTFTLKTAKNKRKIIFKPTFNFSLFGTGINLASD